MQTVYVRDQATRNFTVIHNSVINDKRLSAAARATHIYLLSRPPKWSAWNKDIRKAMGFGRHTYLKVMQELRNAGYQRLEKGGLGGGNILTIYEVSGSPKIELPGRKSEKSTTAKSNHIVKTDKSSKTYSNNNYWQQQNLQIEWSAFKKMRLQKKAPINDIAEARLIANLKILHSEGEDIQEVLNRSIENCWKGVYSIKEKANGRNPQTPADRNRAAGNEYFGTTDW